MKIPSTKFLFRLIALISLLVAIGIWVLFDREVESVISLFMGIASFAASLWAADIPISEQIQTAQYTRHRKLLIQKVERLWITGVLDKLAKTKIDLCMKYYERPIVGTHELKNQERETERERIVSSSELYSIFEESEETLLLLGDAGSGKTICLLSLAVKLLNIARDNQNDPVPIILQLSSWSSEKRPIEQWVINELENKYGFPRSTAEEWLRHDLLILLLDGLSEIKAEHENDCVIAINSFRRKFKQVGLVVSSRLGNYETLKVQLEIPNTIVLQPLLDEQIKSYLVSRDLDSEEILEALKTDQNLRDLAKTPLSLSMLYFSFKELVNNQSLLIETEKGKRFILRQYIHKNLSSCANNPNEEKRLIQVLSWFAKRMHKYDQPIFHANSLQPFWLETRNQRAIFLFLTNIISFSLSGLFIGQSLMILWTLYFKSPFFTTAGYYFIFSIKYFVELIKTQNYLSAIVGLGVYILPALFKLMIDGAMLYFVFAMPKVLPFGFSSFLNEVDVKKKRESQPSPKAQRLIEKNRPFINSLRKSRIVRFLVKSSLETERDDRFGLGIKFYTELNFSVSRLVLGIVLIGPWLFILQTLLFVLLNGLFVKKWSFSDVIFLQDPGFLTFYLVESILMGILFAIALDGILPEAKNILQSRPNKSIPTRQRVIDLVVRAVELGINSGLIAGLIVGIGAGWLMGVESSIALGISSALSFGFLGFWFLGGKAGVRHFVLRLILSWNKYIPWSYENVFERLSRTSLIIDTDKGFMFAHPIIQEYFRKQ